MSPANSLDTTNMATKFTQASPNLPKPAAPPPQASNEPEELSVSLVQPKPPNRYHIALKNHSCELKPPKPEKFAGREGRLAPASRFTSILLHPTSNSSLTIAYDARPILPIRATKI